METLPKLTSTQALLLRAAARRADGRVISDVFIRRHLGGTDSPADAMFRPIGENPA